MPRIKQNCLHAHACRRLKAWHHIDVFCEGCTAYCPNDNETKYVPSGLAFRWGIEECNYISQGYSLDDIDIHYLESLELSLKELVDKREEEAKQNG